ncbi:MAG: hypothetical protein ACI8ZB_001247 [Desulforhopalus sp.]|jgi:hypothetical protein
MNKLVKPITIIACLAISGIAYGVSSSTEPSQADPAKIETAAKKETQVFHGIVKKLDDGMALYTEKEVYPLIGGEFDMINGKEVNITGKIVEEGSIKKLAVNRIQLNK